MVRKRATTKLNLLTQPLRQNLVERAEEMRLLATSQNPTGRYNSTDLIGAPLTMFMSHRSCAVRSLELSARIVAHAAEGATVVVHSNAGDYIRAVLGQRRTLEPDQLEIARSDGRQSQPVVMLVDDVIALTDGTPGVRLHHAPNSRPHRTNDSSRTGSFGCWRMIGTG